MNKIKSFENIFPFYPLPCWKKLGGEKNKFAAGKKINLVHNIHPLLYSSLSLQC